MFVTVKTNDGDMAVINTANITHMTIAAFSGNGTKIYFTSKEGLNVRNSMEEILLQIEGGGPVTTLAAA